MTRKFKSYVPELLFGEEKQEISARICREDFAVIDPGDGYRVVTGRGGTYSSGQNLPRMWQIPKAEIEWLERALVFNRRALLLGAEGPILIFGELLDATGLLLAVRPYLTAKDLTAGLRHVGVRGIMTSPTFADFTASIPTEACAMQISELFYYADRILDTENRFEIGLRTRMHLIANFIGCRVETADLPFADPASSRVERARLTAFLICALSELRKMDGRVRVNGDDEQTSFRCRVELTPIGRLLPTARDRKTALPISNIAAFQNFTVHREEGKLILDAFLQDVSKQSGLHSTIPQYLCLRIELVAV